MRRSLLLVLLLTACAQPEPPPNVIYILADDLGYGELGAYGQELIRTPNLDRLAAEGMRFTQHYSGSPVCAPSRGSLLTGKHTGTAFVRDNFEVGGWGPDEPEGQLPLADSETTIAELLQPMGYRTGFVGKWGLGGPDSEGHPNNQGFDRFYGYLCQRVAHNYYPTHLWSDGLADSLEGNTPWFSAHQRIDAPLDSEMEYYARYQRQTYAPERMIEEALAFLDSAQEDPFFLVYATPIPHLALQVPVEELDAYAGAFDEEPFFGRPYLPHPRPLSAYAAMITYMDRNIGRLLDRLEELGVADNTIVMFSSDNGTTYTGGVEAETFNSTDGLRGLKGSVFEGGIRVPMIARWPQRIAPGTTTDHVSAFWDVLPTLADLTGAAAPRGIDGESFSHVLLGDEPIARERPLYWEYHAFGAMQAVRWDQWKAVRLNAREDPHGPIQLFDLEADRSETTDVAADHPDVVARMDSVMQSRRPSHLARWNFGESYSADG
ncbi:MAG: arylsulfatase [Rhodothermales bacterium]|nr:arylsulfatase [Rhodothermales bacterium]MBO6779780.1 arylsulfatase [Rhodothermales bacterium]